MKNLIALGLCTLLTGFSFALEPEKTPIEDRLTQLENRFTFLSSEFYKVAPDQFHCFGVDEQGFVLLGHEGWLFTVSLENIKPYANGSEITFAISNILGVDLSDITFNLEISHSNTKWKKTEFTINRLNKGRYILQKVRVGNVLPSQINSVCTEPIRIGGAIATEQKE